MKNTDTVLKKKNFVFDKKHILRTSALVTWDMRTKRLEAHFGDKL